MGWLSGSASQPPVHGVCLETVRVAILDKPAACSRSWQALVVEIWVSIFPLKAGCVQQHGFCQHITSASKPFTEGLLPLAEPHPCSLCLQTGKCSV